MAVECLLNRLIPVTYSEPQVPVAYDLTALFFLGSFDLFLVRMLLLFVCASLNVVPIIFSASWRRYCQLVPRPALYTSMSSLGRSARSIAARLARTGVAAFFAVEDPSVDAACAASSDERLPCVASVAKIPASVVRQPL